MSQLDLFHIHREELATARATDPISSHIAAEQMNASGEAKRQAGRIADLVFIAPGSTAHELAAMTAKDEKPLTQVQLLRRLSSIEGVRQGSDSEMRACRVSRRKCVTWWPCDS
jgi:hypothetical protein